MAKKLKKLFTVLMIAAIAIVGATAGVPGQKAEAATTGKSFTYNSYLYGSTPGYIATNEDYYSVYASIEMGYPSGATSPTQKVQDSVTMYLQRYVSGSWTTIDSVSGTVTSGSTLNRTYSNIAKKSTSMRVKAVFGSGQVVYSNTWVR